jgi:hypothetical protein
VLGPEQLNITPRLSPFLLESSAAVAVSEKVAREIGLADNHVVRGVIATRGGLIKLLMNGQELGWAATKKFKPGDSIDFRVRTTANGKILLPISVELAKPLKTANPLINSGESSRLLSLLYRPGSGAMQSEFFRPSMLHDFLKQSLDPTLNQTIAQIMYRMRGITPNTVRDALLGSGLFGEFFLKAQVSGSLDLKQMMRKLLLTSKETGPAKGNIEKIVDEIEGRQLEALQAQQKQELSYHFVMPFVDANPVEIHFQRGAVGANEEVPSWVINLHTESEDLGKLWLKATVTPDLDIGMTLWSERIGTAEKAREAASSLGESLEEFGLKLTKLTILNAARPLVDTAFATPGHVLDIKT